MPPGVTPANNLTYAPASVYNNTTYETGIVRPVPSASLFTISRANNVAYTSSAAVEARFAISFEAVN
jgi:hypothetical protein